MKIGYYVQGAMDVAFVCGLAQRWCPRAELAEPVMRGSSKETFRREIRKAMLDLRDAKGCDILVVLTDSDVNSWRDVKRQESAKVPDTCQHLCVFGVAERNIECWLSIDRQQLAAQLDCGPDDIPMDDPSGFVKRRFGMGERDEQRQAAKERVRDFVATANLKAWIDGSDSFGDFYEEARRLAVQVDCDMVNERDVV
ncbi:MAG: hypothetical protein ACHRHE_04645 [Tepidisphaerales bacterium]